MFQHPPYVVSGLKFSDRQCPANQATFRFRLLWRFGGVFLALRRFAADRFGICPFLKALGASHVISR